MNSQLLPLLTLVVGLLVPRPAAAPSTPIGRNLNFPGDYDPAKAKAILSVVRDERFQFVDGLVSDWPPDWGTRLSYTGDSASLTAFLAALRDVPGVGLRVILYRGRNDELRRDSAWQLDFSQARPDQLTVYLNLNSVGLELDKLELPPWPARTQ